MVGYSSAHTHGYTGPGTGLERRRSWIGLALGGVVLGVAWDVFEPLNGR